jgi:hypothetical protein
MTLEKASMRRAVEMASKMPGWKVSMVLTLGSEEGGSLGIELGWE